MSQDSTNIIWMDLELTGIDPEKDKILEVAVVVTDSQLNIIGEPLNIVIQQSFSVLHSMDQWPLDHHTKSHLVHDSLESIITTKDAEEIILKYLSDKAPCGKTVGGDLEQVLESLNTVMGNLSIKPKYLIIYGGDFNCCTEVQEQISEDLDSYNLYIDQGTLDNYISTRGRILNNFKSNNGCMLINGQCPLAGNTVYMDKFFLMKHMPKVANFFHYRIIDVSSIFELTKRWCPEYKQLEKKLSHRAIPDILESIEQLKLYKLDFFTKFGSSSHSDLSSSASLKNT